MKLLILSFFVFTLVFSSFANATRPSRMSERFKNQLKIKTASIVAYHFGEFDFDESSFSVHRFWGTQRRSSPAIAKYYAVKYVMNKGTESECKISLKIYNGFKEYEFNEKYTNCPNINTEETYL